jgi:hypothetical protein
MLIVLGIFWLKNLVKKTMNCNCYFARVFSFFCILLSFIDGIHIIDLASIVPFAFDHFVF